MRVKVIHSYNVQGHIQGHTSWSSTAWPACGYETRKWSILVHFLPTGGTAGGALFRSRRRTRMCSVCTCTLGRRVRCCVTEINNKSSHYTVTLRFTVISFSWEENFVISHQVHYIFYSFGRSPVFYRYKFNQDMATQNEVLLYLCHESENLIEMWLLKGGSTVNGGCDHSKWGSTVPVSWSLWPRSDVATQRSYCRCHECGNLIDVVAPQRRFYCTLRLMTSLSCGCSNEVLLYLCHDAWDLIEVWLLKGDSTVPMSCTFEMWQMRFYCTCVMRFGTSLRYGCSKEVLESWGLGPHWDVAKEVLLYLSHEVWDLIEMWLLKGGSTESWRSPHWDVAAQSRFYCKRLGASLRCDHSEAVLPASWGSGPHWDGAAKDHCNSIMRLVVAAQNEVLL